MSGDRERIGELATILDEHGLDALTVRFEETTYELVRRDQPTVTAVAAPLEAGAGAPLPPSAPQRNVTPSPSANYKRVVAPIVGVFYRSSAPGAEPFVEVGSRVEAGEVVCILEAMKLMNEITTDYAGTVRRILPENGALVSLGEEMLWIEP
ncbi:MAG TPA: acetyl-CoA carboxylase biotin carboxyl carrier protein [Candidatus Acidoferrales bacterium]|nr:acetyl-CoA carboxylase biotin carboxyl carrier protein [Candidatus Acidoferrales bacterium]